MESYIKARKIAITLFNVLGGWRGTGLFPLNKHRILHQLSGNHSKSTLPTERATATQFPSTSSPPDHNILQSANTAFNTALSQTAAPSPVKTHGRCLTEITVRLAAENAILRKDNSEWGAQIQKQKERVKGKYFVLKDQHAISTEEMYKAIDGCEKATWKRATKGKPRWSKRTQHISSSEEEEAEDTDSELEEDDVEIWDCIEVIRG